jgi:O-antigen/teichoic acid export membrane protein
MLLQRSVLASKGFFDPVLRSSQLHKNVATNTVNTLLNALAGLIILPFLISKLGSNTYGIWTLIVATTGLFTLLDFGITAGVGRQLAVHHRNGDIQKINVVLSSSLFMLLLVATAIVLSTLLAVEFFPHFFKIPEGQVGDVKSALLIMGFATAAYFPASIFDGVLWGYERFDLHNLVEIPGLLIRTSLTLGLIGSQSTLLVLACIIVFPTLIGYTVRAGICWNLEPRLRISSRLVDLKIVKETVDFGRWFGTLTMLRAAIPQISTFVVGHALGPAAVTIFTIPRQLLAYANWLLAATTQVIGPKAAVMHSAGEVKGLRQLYVVGSQYAFALSLYVCGGLLLLGAPFLDLWLPSHSGQEYQILVILAVCEAFILPQWVSQNLLISIGRPQPLAKLAMIEFLAVLIVTSTVVSFFGLTGVSAAVALVTLSTRGVAQAALASRFAGLDLHTYFSGILTPVLCIAALPILLFAAVLQFWQPASWVEFVIAGGLYSSIFALLTKRYFARKSLT